MTAVTYLVGGAVRDALLGLPVTERDWVITGSTPEALKAQGYRQVGASFPVFLHPDTGEEYALARTERKAGSGYHGFEVAFDPEITIEQDLLRRDLTINAMARDPDDRLIDPYGGRADLDARLLRHVSPAFAEDPLRVLRVARFAARFAPLGFRVHEDTLALMQQLSDSGELHTLVPERAWTELRKAMGSADPACFVSTLRACHGLRAVLPELDALFGVADSSRQCRDDDAGAQVLRGLSQCARLGASESVTLAVLLHALGKASTPLAQRPDHRGHEQAGLPLLEAVCDRFRVSNEQRRLALQLCAQEAACQALPHGDAEAVMQLLEALDAFRQPQLDAFLLACEAIARARGELAEDAPYVPASLLLAAREAAAGVSARALQAQGIQGPALGQALRLARREAIAEQLVAAGQ